MSSWQGLYLVEGGINHGIGSPAALQLPTHMSALPVTSYEVNKPCSVSQYGRGHLLASQHLHSGRVLPVEAALRGGDDRTPQQQHYQHAAHSTGADNGLLKPELEDPATASNYSQAQPATIATGMSNVMPNVGTTASNTVSSANVCSSQDFASSHPSNVQPSDEEESCNIDRYATNIKYHLPEYKEYVQMQDFHTAARVVDSAYNLLAINANCAAKFAISWQPVSVNTAEYQPGVLSFTAPVGPVHASDGDTPLEIFRGMLDVDVVAMIINEMNRFGRKMLSDEVCVGHKKKKLKVEISGDNDNQTPKKKITEWLDLDTIEFWSFMAVLFYMSVVKIPTIKRYWNKDLWGQPAVQSLMKRDRFSTLLRCLEFADQTDVNSADNSNLAKILPILDKMAVNFQEQYQPECHLSLNETMLQSNCKYKPRTVTGETTVPPSGVRCYILCEARSGYVLDFFVYTGKNTVFSSDLGIRLGSNRTSELAACKLLTNFKGKGHVLYSDNFYSSPHLFAFLKSHAGIDCVGIVQPSIDGFPDPIRTTNAHICKGEVASMLGRVYNTTVLAQTWRLKEEGSPRFVSILSTRHPATTKVVAQKSKGYLHKPVSYLEYSEHSSGIDKVDQTSAPFPGEDGPSTKHHYKIFLRFVHLALHNAYIIWRSFNPKSILGYGSNFRLQLMKELKHEADTYKRQPVIVCNFNEPYTGKSDSESHVSQRHVLTRTPPMSNNVKRRSRRRCVQCWNASCKRSQSTYECCACNQGFCPPCFNEYHANLKLPTTHVSRNIKSNLMQNNSVEKNQLP